MCGGLETLSHDRVYSVLTSHGKFAVFQQTEVNRHNTELEETPTWLNKYIVGMAEDLTP